MCASARNVNLRCTSRWPCLDPANNEQQFLNAFGGSFLALASLAACVAAGFLSDACACF